MAIYPQQINDWLMSQFPSDQMVRPEDVKFQGVEVNASGELINIPVVYGRRRITPPRVFASVKSNNSNILYAVYAVSEGPITAYDKLFINDVPVGITSTGGLLTIGSGLYGGKLTVDLKLGNASGNNSTLFDEITGVASDFTNLKTSLVGMAYVVLKMTYTPDGPFQEVPKVTLDVCGRKLRNSSSIGSEQSVYENANPADVLLDLLTNDTYGRGLNDSKIDTTSLSSLRSSFESTLQSYIGGPYIKRGQVNWIMNTGNTVLSNVNELCRQFGIIMTLANGRYRFVPEHTSSTYVMTVTNDHLIDSWSYSVPDLSRKYNSVSVTYPDIDNNFQENAQTYTVASDQSADGKILEVNINYDAVTNGYLARFAAQSLYLKSRTQRIYRFRMTSAALQLIVGDIIVWDPEDTGSSTNYLRIISMSMSDDMTFNIEAVTHKNEFYPPFTLKSKIPLQPEIKPTPPGAITPTPVDPITPGTPTPIVPPTEIVRPPENTTNKITAPNAGETYLLTDGLGTDFYHIPLDKFQNFTTSVDSINYRWNTTLPQVKDATTGSTGVDVRVLEYSSSGKYDYYYMYKPYVTARNRNLDNISLGGEGLIVLNTVAYDRIYFAYEIGNGQFGVVSKLPGTTGALQTVTFDPETQSQAIYQLGTTINFLELSDVIYSKAERSASYTYYGFPSLVFNSNTNYYTTDGLDGLRYYLSYSTYAGQRWSIPSAVWAEKQNFALNNQGSRMTVKYFVVNNSGQPTFLGKQTLNLKNTLPSVFGLGSYLTTSRNNYFKGTKSTAPF